MKSGREQHSMSVERGLEMRMILALLKKCWQASVAAEQKDLDSRDH